MFLEELIGGTKVKTGGMSHKRYFVGCTKGKELIFSFVKEGVEFSGVPEGDVTFTLHKTNGVGGLRRWSIG